MASFPDLTRSDPWIITPEDRMKHDAQFNQLKPIAGFLTGEQAKVFFLQSGLPMPILGKIWQLSDLNADGRMDRREFSIAMHLIKKTLLGFEIPPVLPSSLVVDQVAGPAMGAFGTGVAVPSYVPANPAPLSSRGASVPTGSGGFGNSGMVAPPNYVAQPRPATVNSGGEWCIPQGQRFKYKQLFNSTDVSHKGYLTGLEAKNILSQSGLVHSILAQIWSLADIDTDGNLSPDEFCVAMYLIDIAKSGQSVPPVLPPDLIPPAYRRMRRPSETVSLPVAPSSLVMNVSNSHGGAAVIMDSFGDLGQGFGSQAAFAAQADAAGGLSQDNDPLKVVTFEDRRKENFDKGQAELERRREMLRAQQQKESEERLAAERAEQEKRERIRLEQEHKKQMEMEKQFEKQRHLEMEREEQRKKAMEQREAARQELERQRQLEWERQRRDQLMSERQREQSQVDRLRLEVGQLKLELESFDAKKMELFSRMEQVRLSISEFTSAIDSMKLSRDAKLSDIENFQSEFEEWNMKLVAAQQERLRLGRQVHTPDPGADDNFKTIESGYRTRKSAVDQLSSRLEKVEEEKTNINKQMNESASQLTELKNQMNSLMSDYSKLEKVLSAKKAEWDERKGRPSSVPLQNSKLDSKLDAFGLENDKTSKADSLGSIGWFTDFKKAPATSNNTFDAWGMSATDTKTLTDPSNKNDIWAFNSDLTEPPKELQSNSNAWANFDGTDAFSAVSQSADSSQTAADVNWAADFFPSTTSAVETEASVKKTGLQEGFNKYTALYQFDARNPDELSLVQGDVIWVKLDQSKAEPDWLIGQKDGVEGCFPMAYVQLADNDIYPDIPTKSSAKTSATKEPWPPNDIFPGSDAVYDTPPRMSDGKASVSGNNQGQPVMSQLTTSAESSFMPVSSSAPLTMPRQTQNKSGAVDGLQVQALYPWQAKKENHLTFKKGDIITVLDQQDIWWSGQLNGKVGWFPKSYVKVTGSDSSGASSNKANQSFSNTNSASNLSSMRPPTPPHGAPPLPVVSLVNSVHEQSAPAGVLAQRPEVKVTGVLGNNSSPVSTSLAAPSNGTDDTVVVAMYTYTSEEPADLTFNQGDVFTIQKMEGDWWTGTMNGKTGIFPATYVRVMENLTPHKLAGVKKPEIASVIAPYQATGQEQLTLQPGQLIHVRKKSPSGWWEGELQARGMKRRIGWFPANYVKLLGQGGSAVNTPDISGNSPSDHVKGSTTPVGFSAPTNPPSVEQVLSLYNYQAQRDDELSFPKGCTINILNKDDRDWWKGEFNGKLGMFPANYVTPLASKDNNLTSS